MIEKFAMSSDQVPNEFLDLNRTSEASNFGIGSIGTLE
jgi:hypothetical protein